MFTSPHPHHYGFAPPNFADPKLAPTFQENGKFEQMDPLQNQLCRVCEEPAAGFHFGAFTCEGCKSFFGRTCNNQSVIQECKNNYRCVVDKKNRTACKACRLRKCLMVGMSKSGSRYGRRSNWFKIHCLMQQNGSKPPAGNPPPPQPLPVSHPGIERSIPPTISWPPPRDHPIMTSLGKPDLPKSISRSPSPIHISLPSDSSIKSSQSPIHDTFSPKKILDISPRPGEISPNLPIIPPPTSLHSLYPFPPPLPFLSSSPFPFYRLSPLLAGNPFLANSILFSMAGQKPHMDLLKEHKTLLDTYGSSHPGESAAKQADRSPNHVRSADSPIDLSVRNEDKKVENDE